jgi:hypothetical protein
LRLPFSSPPTTRRVTVEVFDPASTRASLILVAAILFKRLDADRIDNTVHSRMLSVFLYRGNEFTDPLPGNGSDITAHLTVVLYQWYYTVQYWLHLQRESRWQAEQLVRAGQ